MPENTLLWLLKKILNICGPTGVPREKSTYVEKKFPLRQSHLLANKIYIFKNILEYHR